MKTLQAIIRYSFVAAVMLITPCCGTPPPAIVWDKHLGTASLDSVSSVFVDGNGNAYLCGRTGGGLFGSGSGKGDAFLAKYDPAGSLLWGKQLGTAEDDECSGIAADASGNVYLCGSTLGSLGGANSGKSDGFVAKLSSAGAVLWVRQLGTDREDRCSALALSSAGLVVVGVTSGSLFAANPDNQLDVCIMQYDFSGDRLWGVQLAHEGVDTANDVRTDGQGAVFIAGSTESLFAPNTGMDKAFLAKLDAAGALTWGRQFGYQDNRLDSACALSIDGDGAAYVGGVANAGTGAEEGAGDGFLAKYDGSGNQLWIRYIQSADGGQDAVLGVATLARSGAYVVGDSSGNVHGASNGETDVFLARYDASGSLAWGYQFGSSAADHASGVALDSSSAIYVGGTTSGNLYGSSVGRDDCFLGKFVE